MKAKKSLWGSVSVLVGLEVLNAALLRGNLALAVGGFIGLVWLSWIIARFGFPLHPASRRKRLVEELDEEFADTDEDEDCSVLERYLQLHVNRRISAALHSSFPDATWNWDACDPLGVILEHDLGAIHVYGVSGCTHAAVRIDDAANISLVPDAAGGAFVPSPVDQDSDVEEWYQQEGVHALNEAIVTLSTRGYQRMTLDAEGNLLADRNNAVSHEGQLEHFPGKNHLERLAELIRLSGIQTEQRENTLLLSW